MPLLAEVLRGGAKIARTAGMAIVGGHTIDDPEPKYGLCVIGRVDPDETMTIDAARPDDVLVLTKPVGTGIITTAVKNDAAPPAALEAAVASMTHLNAAAAQTLVKAGVRACTDVTGFGLLGHLHRVCMKSGVGAEIDADALPLLPHARDLCEAGQIPGGTRRNLKAVADHTDFGGASETMQLLLCDAQTSGGLLAAVPAEKAGSVVRALSGEPAAAIVGRITEGEPGRISVKA